MDNIRALEKRWYFYKIKKYLIYINTFGFAVMLSLGAYYAFTKSQSNVDLLIEKKAEIQEYLKINEPVVAVEEATSNTAIPQKVENVDTNNKYEVSLETVIPIIDMEREERKPVPRQIRTQNPVKKERVVRAKPSAYLTASELVAVNNSLDTTKIKKITLNATSKNYIKTIKEKFSNSKNPREALLLAKAYYAEAKYKEAENWALMANKLNNNLDESWFVFAKSKAKMGQRDEAIKILASYYKKTHAPKAKELIEKIKKGSL